MSVRALSYCLCQMCAWHTERLREELWTAWTHYLTSELTHGCLSRGLRTVSSLAEEHHHLMFSKNGLPHHLWEDCYQFVGTGQCWGGSVYFSSPTLLDSPNNKIFMEWLSGKVYFLKVSFSSLIWGWGGNWTYTDAYGSSLILTPLQHWTQLTFL